MECGKSSQPSTVFPGSQPVNRSIRWANSQVGLACLRPTLPLNQGRLHFEEDGTVVAKLNFRKDLGIVKLRLKWIGY